MVTAAEGCYVVRDSGQQDDVAMQRWDLIAESRLAH